MTARAEIYFATYAIVNTFKNSFCYRREKNAAQHLKLPTTLDYISFQHYYLVMSEGHDLLKTSPMVLVLPISSFKMDIVFRY